MRRPGGQGVPAGPGAALFGEEGNERMRKFSFQLFLFLFLSAFLLLAAGLLVMYQVSVKATVRINNDMRSSIVDTCGKNLNMRFAEADNIANSVFLQEDALNSLTLDVARSPRAFTALRRALISAAANNDFIASIGIYDTNAMEVKTPSTAVLPYHDYDSCLAHFARADTRAQWKTSLWSFNERISAKSGKGTAIANLRPITPLYPRLGKKICMVIHFSEAKLCELYAFLGADSCLADGNGVIFSAVDKARIGQTVDGRILSWIRQQGRASSGYRQTGGAFAFLAPIPVASAYLITSSTAAALGSAQHAILLTSLIMVAAGLLVSLVGAHLISRMLARPLLQLKNTMIRVEKGDLSARSGITRVDEIGYLSDTFNLLMDSLVRQMSALSRQQELTKESEIRLLQAQINPHLLYNTLDSALFLIGDGNAGLAVKILEELSRFFKLSLQSGSKVVTVEKEIQHVASYISLQNLCRMKNIRLQVCCDSGLRALPLVHMLLQPIVENSVLHGFEGDFDDGEIRICVDARKGMLRIRIRDNGMGMEEKELRELRSSIAASEPAPTGFALWNIAKRIRIYYGSRSELTVESEFSEYTEVTLKIPIGEYRSGDHV